MNNAPSGRTGRCIYHPEGEIRLLFYRTMIRMMMIRISVPIPIYMVPPSR
jgi:hypothetical protein